jgi:hypothetical protein
MQKVAPLFRHVLCEASIRWAKAALERLPSRVMSSPIQGGRGGLSLSDCSSTSAMMRSSSGRPTHARESSLNELMATSQELRLALRHALSGILKLGFSAEQAIGESGTPLLHDSAVCQMHLPAHVGGYTDFFASIHHAVRAGQLLRSDSPRKHPEGQILDGKLSMAVGRSNPAGQMRRVSIVEYA